MVRTWRAETRRGAGRARGEEALLVEVPLPCSVLEVIWAAEDVEEAAEDLGLEWWWMHPAAEMRLYPGGGNREGIGPGLWERVALARRRVCWGGSRGAIRKLLGWEVAAGREESSNGRWAVAELLEVERPIGRRGLQLEVLVRWSGEQPLSRAPWPQLWRPVTALSEDLKRKAREMEFERYGGGGSVWSGEADETQRAIGGPGEGGGQPESTGGGAGGNRRGKRGVGTGDTANRSGGGTAMGAAGIEGGERATHRARRGGGR